MLEEIIIFCNAIIKHFFISYEFYIDPFEWDSNDISSWLKWCTKAFSLESSPNLEALGANSGREILDLKLEEWQKRLPDCGRVLAKHLGYLRLQASGNKTKALVQEEKCRSNGKFVLLLIVNLFCS